MSLFSYKARTSSGGLIAGEVEGDNIKAVKLLLVNQGLLPVQVLEKGISIKIPEFLSFKRSLKTRDLMSFTRQFGTLFKAGVSMERIFKTLSRQIEHADFKEAIAVINSDVASGSTLATAFGKHPRFFSELYCNMLNVGEEGGSLEESLKSLAAIIERDNTITTRIKSATLYPKIVLTVFFGVVVLMMTFVIPRFADFYGGFGAELPLPTRILMGTSDIFVSYWYIVLGAVMVIIIGLKRYFATEKGGMNLDKLKFRLPVFGKLSILVANSRFGHLVGALYKSGVPLVKTLSIVGKAIGNKAYKQEMDAANEEVQQGRTLADALTGKKYFTSVVVESVAVGEQSGALDEMLEITAEFYDEESNAMLAKLTTLIEPLLLIGLFGMVLLLALAIFLPMWRVSSIVLEGG